MPTFSEISDLRKAGHLQEALDAAQNWLQTGQDNLWAKRAISWVYYDFLKQYTEEDNFDQFCLQLDVISELEFPADEAMFFENLAFAIGKYIFYLSKKGPQTSLAIISLFQKLKAFPFPKPSKAYSFLLKALHKGLKDTVHYKEVVDWWDLNNFLEEDFEKEEVNERQVMAFAEMVLIAYSKKLLPAKTAGLSEQTLAVGAIRNFLPFLRDITTAHPSLTFLPYFEAKLMIAAGQEGEASHSILPFARKKQKEYWVWQVLAEAHPEDIETQIACYARALTYNAKEDFLVNIRLSLADLLIQTDNLAAAKFEIDKSYNVRNQHGWKIPAKITAWQQLDWYTQTKANTNNTRFYNQYAVQAEEVIYQDIPTRIGAIHYVNQEKKLAGFLVSPEISGNFKFHQLGSPVKVGQMIELRLQERKGDSGKWYKVLTVKPSPGAPPESLIKSFAGRLHQREGWSFGLIDDIFVPPHLVNEHDLNTGDTINGKAILSYDKKKDRWGFSAYSITLHH